MIIAVDFDGTCVTHEFPKVGRDIGAAPVLRALVASGHQLILWTMRSDQELVEVTPAQALSGISTGAGTYLTQAVNWFKENGIELWGINENPEQKSWTGSPKAFANIYIDDAALGCPLHSAGDVDRPFVNWDLIGKHFVSNGIINSDGIKAIS